MSISCDVVTGSSWRDLHTDEDLTARMSHAQFVHLHTHSDYSLLDGAARLDLLVKRAADMDMPALALTDHGAMYGAIDFYIACRAAGIKPITGMEAYLAPAGRLARGSQEARKNRHVTLLAADREGYRNLLQLATLASLEGFYDRPRIDREDLASHCRGLIVLSGCISGELCVKLLEHDYQGALGIAGTYKDIFGPDHYFIELQNHGLDRQAVVNDGLRRIARELGLKTVCTNDVHYLTQQDAYAHEVLLCIGTGKTMQDPDHMRYDSDQFYLKSAEEMSLAFPDDGDAIARTAEIAERCNLELEFNRTDLPQPDIPEGMSAQEYLNKLAWEGLERRIARPTDGHRNRLRHELSVIEKTGFAEYILIVRDFAAFARKQGILFGVRGSAAGSLTSYCVEITDVDPVHYDLTFERFLNPERAEMPDIDMDFEDGRRAEVIEYVTQKYGPEHVAQIATFGTLQPKQVVKDAGRALGLPFSLVNRVAGLIPAQGAHLTLAEAVDKVGELKRLYETDTSVHRLIDTAQRLEGLARHTSIHAAGIVISRTPLVEHTPLRRTAEGNARQTQYPAPALAKIGLLKMDFLGLINLSILGRSLENVRRVRGVQLSLDSIPLEDKATFELLGRGETVGVFQLESSGMRRYIRALKPTSVNDLAAMVALYRPGPMESIPEFIAAKHGRKEVRFLHPRLEPLLAETYGVIVYQDQVLTVVREIGGFTMGQADLFRRAISKKIQSDIDRMHDQFLEGAVRQGISENVAERIYDLIKPFAGYGFNKAHAVCYALVAYQTAYLKAHYPVEYMAALLACYAGKADKMAVGLAECKRMGICVLGPDINASACDFAPEGSAIRYGLADIKNVGRAVAEAIVAERDARGPFQSLQDFCKRLYAAASITRLTVETLVRCGAFDTLHPNRRAMFECIPDALAFAASVRRSAEMGHASLFGDDEISSEPVLPISDAGPDFPVQERLKHERDLLGVFLSGHPLEKMPDLANDPSIARAAELREMSDGETVTVAGIVADVRQLTTRLKQPMAYARLEDLTGPIAVTCFPKVYAAYRDALVEDAVVRVSGRISARESDSSSDGGDSSVEIIADRIERIQWEESHRTSRKALHIRVTGEIQSRLRLLRSVLDMYPGDSSVFVHVATDTGGGTIRSSVHVDRRPELLEALERLLGPQSVWQE